MHKAQDFLSQMYHTDHLHTIETDLQIMEDTKTHYDYVIAGGVLLVDVDYNRTKIFLAN